MWGGKGHNPRQKKTRIPRFCAPAHLPTMRSLCYGYEEEVGRRIQPAKLFHAIQWHLRLDFHSPPPVAGLASPIHTARRNALRKQPSPQMNPASVASHVSDRHPLYPKREESHLQHPANLLDTALEALLPAPVYRILAGNFHRPNPHHLSRFSHFSPTLVHSPHTHTHTSISPSRAGSNRD